MRRAVPVGLELIAARAWPAVVEARIGGWRLYATDGHARRINACWPLEDPGRPIVAPVTPDGFRGS